MVLPSALAIFGHLWSDSVILREISSYCVVRLSWSPLTYFCQIWTDLVVLGRFWFFSIVFNPIFMVRNVSGILGATGRIKSVKLRGRER